MKTNEFIINYNTDVNKVKTKNPIEIENIIIQELSIIHFKY